jgi:hypothetical protein
MTMCSACGAIVDATVLCYDGAHRCLPCAAAAGFAWRSNDAVVAALDHATPLEADDLPPPCRRPRRGALIHLTGYKLSPRR